jgi:Uma2 family endonuclease
MALIKAKPATYADIEALPAHWTGQILHGVLHAHPRPAPRHSRAEVRLSSELDGPFDRGRGGPGGWIFLIEPELHLGPHVLVPDIAGWRRERMTPFPKTSFVTPPPDWVCEVLSPSTERIDRNDKLPIYAEYRVGQAWYVDPELRVLEVLARSGPAWQLVDTVKNADPVTAPPFEVHTFSLDVLWPAD